MIHCQSYTANPVPGTNGRHLIFNIHDDREPDFHIPQDVLKLLMRTAREVGCVPDDVTACFVGIIRELKKQRPLTANYTVEMAVVPQQ
jgi:hypothetical protein